MAEHRLPSNREGAFTLVELMVVAGTLGLLSVMMSYGLSRSQGFATAELSRTAVAARFNAAMDRVLRDLAIGRVDEPVDSGTRVRYMLPIDHDDDGVMYDSKGEVTWGFPVNGTPTISAAGWFQYVVDQSLDEQDIQFDVNLDGDQDDVFDVGHLEQVLPGAGNVRITGSWILQLAGNPGADLDDDGDLDPMFSVTETTRAKLFRVQFFGLHRLPDGGWERSDFDSSVRLYNDAP